MTESDQTLSLGTALDFMRGLWQLNHALEQLSSRMEDELDVSAQQHCRSLSFERSFKVPG